MSIMKVNDIFSTKSYYVKTILTKLKIKNKFHIEECEEAIDIYDFFEELFNMIQEERKGRNNNE